MYNHAPEEYKNPLVLLAAGEPVPKFGDQEPFVFYRDEFITAFVPTSTEPQNQGNVLIIPNQPFENLYDIPDELLAKIHVFSKRVALAMKKTYDCDGVSVRQHNEPAGYQEVWHYHLHIIPRYEDDNLYPNYLTKVDSNATIRVEYAQKLRDYFSNNQ